MHLLSAPVAARDEIERHEERDLALVVKSGVPSSSASSSSSSASSSSASSSSSSSSPSVEDLKGACGRVSAYPYACADKLRKSTDARADATAAAAAAASRSSRVHVFQ